ncbi:unnamed protein product [Vitrella brassicaformis CCMP3155]|uniref:Uncharacterized protein n=1 Tax=Vitrella brassicaformis (strain CCMP3155) TaxID=1169540 RepID=A0A0G4GNQ2_VITBC|nr:unnamed protein product [Vitrella brassicaformis CCMP3155]|eukprot:CEM31928.1 unnamed protein product [Vitrella brassicaformis CCMP3155]
MSKFAELHSTTSTTIEDVNNLSEQVVAQFYNVRETTLKDIELEFKLEATGRDKTLIKTLHIDYPNEISRDKKSATIRIPSLLKAEYRILLIELEVPEESFSTDKSTRILSVSGNYSDMRGPKLLSLTRIVEA